jgi:cation diffusion facilitator CzcD-associated flavoprotein CzcO
MAAYLPIAIIGAGPYGLSVAAHLRGRGVEFRIFGRTMDSWLTQMPRGMHLKSEAFASSLSDPQSVFTLKQFCLNNDRRYSDLGVPVPLDTLTDYGLAFQKKFVPEVENKMVSRLDRGTDGFALTFDDGETVYACSVLVAVGLSYFKRIPSCLANLSSEFLTHSSAHHDLTPFRGRDVVVIGGGSSAIDVATLLHEGGTAVRLAARGQNLEIHDKTTLPRPLWDRIRAPMSGIGPGWRSVFCTETPRLFHALPEKLRVRVVRTYIPPAAGWFMKDRFTGKVSTLLGYEPERAEIQGGRINLLMRGRDGSERKLVTEHVIAATGFAPDVRQLSFLSERILGQLQTAGNTPVLSPHFQSTVPGLYFAGPMAANSFGPVLRFIVGAKFTAPRIANHLARSYRPRAIPITSPAYGDSQAIAPRRGRSAG